MMSEKSRDDDANKYIAPNPRPHIDREKQKQQQRIWDKGLELLRAGYIREFERFLVDSGLTSEQLARARDLLKKHYRI